MRRRRLSGFSCVSVLVSALLSAGLCAVVLSLYVRFLNFFYTEKEKISILLNQKRLSSIFDLYLSKSHFTCQGHAIQRPDEHVEVLQAADPRLPSVFKTIPSPHSAVLSVPHYGDLISMADFLTRSWSQKEKKQIWIATDCQLTQKIQWEDSGAIALRKLPFQARYVVPFHRDYYFVGHSHQRRLGKPHENAFFQYRALSKRPQKWVCGIDNIDFEILNSTTVFAKVRVSAHRFGHGPDGTERRPSSWQWDYHANIG